jgi:transposase
MDARSLSIETQEYLRQQAIHLRQQGQSFIDIGDFLGVHRNTVGRWWQEYEVDGDKALQQRVQPWLAEHSQPIEVFYLPSYSPQLNPVEYLNGDVKQGVHSKSPSRNLNQLKGRVLSHLRKLQKLPQRILSYFKHPLIAYASQQMHSILLPG